MNVEDSATGIGWASCRTTIGPHSDRSVAITSGRQRCEHAAQVGELVRDRLDEPVAQHGADPPACLSIARMLRNARSWSRRSKAKNSNPSLSTARAHGLAAEEGDLVAALAQRAGDRHLRQQVPGERP